MDNRHRGGMHWCCGVHIAAATARSVRSGHDEIIDDH